MPPTSLPKQVLEFWTRARELAGAGRLHEADAAYRAAWKLAPASADLVSDYARFAGTVGDWKAAEQLWETTARLNPQRVAHDRRGIGLLHLKRPAEARAAMLEHLRRHPPDAITLANLGTCEHQLGQDDAAEQHFRAAVALRPDYAHGWLSLVKLLIQQCRPTDAQDALDQAQHALPHDPALAHARMEHLLKRRDFSAGFALFNTRWHGRPARGSVPAEARRWDGKSCDGALLVHAEQGIGDQILFSSLFSELAAVHPDTTVTCDKRLQPLFARSFPQLQFITTDEVAAARKARSFADELDAGDLCAIFRRTATDFPPRRAWLVPDPARLAACRAQLANHASASICAGIAWRSSNPLSGHNKSIPPTALGPLLATPGAVFVNLQYGDTSTDEEQLATAGLPVPWRYPDIDTCNDLDGLAAGIAALDLVISTSNSTVHLSAALGIETWTLLPRDNGLLWYWGYEGEQVEWYPSMRLIRCQRRGQWAGAISNAARNLAGRVTHPPGGQATPT